MSLEMVKYESAYGAVELTAEDVTKYLARGNSDLTDKEIKLFLELCKFQKINPFVGEAYAIKFGSEFQMVIGYDTYKRRAEENPTYAGRKSGITVLRNTEVIQKEGTCLYPGETLVGGWCRVFRKIGDRIDETFKEVGLKEYDKGQANWKTRPCTMIEKVAVSQALRNAFPTDYVGLYTAEEFSQDEANVERTAITCDGDIIDTNIETVAAEADVPITQEQRLAMFQLVYDNFGKEAGNDLVAKLLKDEGLESTTGLPISVYKRLLERIGEAINKANADKEQKNAAPPESAETQPSSQE